MNPNMKVYLITANKGLDEKYTVGVFLSHSAASEWINDNVAPYQADEFDIEEWHVEG